MATGTPAEASKIGYGVIAPCMNSDRDLSMFQRFGTLNARNLLCMQSELAVLEEQLQVLDTRSNNSTEHWSLPRSWYNLEKDDGELLKLVLKIREKFDAYSKIDAFTVESFP
jgi:hypothetical protein